VRPLSEGSRMALRGYRYVAGFLLLNFVLAWMGTAPFRAGAADAMGRSLLADRLLHGFDLSVLADLMVRPELGHHWAGASLGASLLFALVSLVFMPGVLQAYAGGGCLPREAFFAACGHHLWRFVRLALLFLLAAGILAALLGLGAGFTVDAARRGTGERLPDVLALGSFLVILAVMTLLRMLFDLAQAHVVVRDQKAVRRSLSAALRLVRAHGGGLLGAYLLVDLLAGLVLAAGLWTWYALLPSHSLAGSFLLSQLILLLLLAARFWQRAAAVAAVKASQ
jgi:hypothetical protein